MSFWREDQVISESMSLIGGVVVGYYRRQTKVDILKHKLENIGMKHRISLLAFSNQSNLYMQCLTFRL